MSKKLESCWPLHPVTASLLGPSMKRRFGQNERSIFSFLSSAESLGFREFVENTTLQSHSYFYPWQFWDYLRCNFEPAILASGDGHKWAIAVEAVERAEAKGTLFHIQLVKTIAAIDLFRNGSGLSAETDLLAACIPNQSKVEVEAALSQLANWSVVIYRKHLSAWAIYAGSDFDIEAATTKARAEINRTHIHSLIKINELVPVLAKRVYQETGAMHFLARSIVPVGELEAFCKAFKPQVGSCGELILALPQKGFIPKAVAQMAQHLTSNKYETELLIGIPIHSARITELSEELFALQHVYARSTELEGDRVATREITARLEALKAELDERLREAFLSSRWFWRGKQQPSVAARGLSSLASSVASHRYASAPIFISELLNRENPSSNSVKARRDLMHRMLAHSEEEKLGYAGFSADAGLYFTLLQSTSLHRKRGGTWGFLPLQRTDEENHCNRSGVRRASSF